MDERPIYYVYVLFRPWNGWPCYVGKGKFFRWKDHEKRTKNLHLARIVTKAGSELPKIKLRENLTEKEAFEIERALIAAIGRGKDGPLVNLTDGGEGVSGLKHSDETKEKIRKDKIAFYAEPENRKKGGAATKAAMANPDVRAHLCEVQKTRFANMSDDEKNEVIGRVTNSIRTEESYRIVSQKLTGLVRSPETRARVGASKIGRSMSEETCESMSIAAKRRSESPQERARLSEIGRLGAESRWAKRKKSGEEGASQ